MEGELGQKCNWIKFHAIGPLTPCHWIIHHSIGQYTSCYWMRLNVIGSYVIRSDYILHVIGLDFILLEHTSFDRIISLSFMSLDQASCHCNTSFCEKTTFVLLNLNWCHWIIDHSIKLYIYVCHWTGSNFISLDRKRHSIGPAAYWKKLVSQNAFQIIFRVVVLRRRCFAVWKFWIEMDNLMKRMETLLREVVDHLERNRNLFGAEVGQEGEASQEGNSGGNSSNSSLTEASVEFR